VSETTVVAVRHGETEWNRTSRMQGWAHVPLNERGREQARRVGTHLAAEYDFDRVVSSDIQRVRETTAHVRDAGVAPEPTFDPGWRERGMGRYQGFTRAELFDRHPEFDYANGFLSLEARPEGGESIVDLRERVLEAFGRLCVEAAGETVLVVTHGGPVQMVYSAVTGTDLLASKTRSLSNCSVTEFRGPTPAQMRVVRDNETVAAAD
jgi:probable phosphoglycerate mutase